jgi:hypothetical protein
LLFIDQDDVPNLAYVGAMSRGLESAPFVYSKVDVERLNPEWLWHRWEQRTPVFVGGWPLHLGGTLGVHRGVYEKSDGWSTDPWLDDGDFCYRVFLSLGSAPTRAEGALLHYRYRTDAQGVFRQQRRWGRIAARTNRKFRPLGYKVPSEWAAIATHGWHLARSMRALLDKTDRYFWMAEAGEVLGRTEMNIVDVIRGYKG